MNIDLSEYNYALPEERIAQFPLTNRSESKLLVYDKGKITDTRFSEIKNYLNQDSFLIFNNTKVINARIFFKKTTGAKIEIFCLEPAYGKTVEEAFASYNESEWKCFVGNASKWRNEKLEKNFIFEETEKKLFAEKIFEGREEFIIKFSWEGKISFADVMNLTGTTPLPPYIKRNAVIDDGSRYQTVYAEIEGSVAAPTAGLHFTKDIIADLNTKNISFDKITLNVGAGTFKPVKGNDISTHKMHEERFSVKKSFLTNLLNAMDKTKVAIGTTSVRTLESLYWLGVLPDKISKDNFNLEQWEVYNYKNLELANGEEAIKNLINYCDNNNISEINGSTSLIIIPGYEFKYVDSMITNFHLPCSTLLLLVSAFVGEDWKQIYEYALKNDFRFLSYGDTSILNAK